MPMVICSYCEYVGTGKAWLDKVHDVILHEEKCEQRRSEEETHTLSGD